MATELRHFTWCDRHLQDKDETEPGETWTVSIQAPGQRAPRAMTVDACPACGMVLREAQAFMAGYGRKANGATEPEASPSAEFKCPLCEYVGNSRKHLGQHGRNVHEIGIRDLLGEDEPGEVDPEPAQAGDYPCPDCDRVLASPQGLGAHRWHTHGIPSPTREAREARE